MKELYDFGCVACGAFFLAVILILGFSVLIVCATCIILWQEKKTLFKERS